MIEEHSREINERLALKMLKIDNMLLACSMALIIVEAVLLLDNLILLLVYFSLTVVGTWVTHLLLYIRISLKIIEDVMNSDKSKKREGDIDE